MPNTHAWFAPWHCGLQTVGSLSKYDGDKRDRKKKNNVFKLAIGRPIDLQPPVSRVVQRLEKTLACRKIPRRMKLKPDALAG